MFLFWSMLFRTMAVNIKTLIRPFLLVVLSPSPILKRITYTQWIKKIEKLEDAKTEQILLQGKEGVTPLISIVTPVFNPPLNVLTDTIRSVIAQTYTNWEFCIANGGDNCEVKTY